MFFYILGSGTALPGNIDMVNCFEDSQVIMAFIDMRHRSLILLKLISQTGEWIGCGDALPTIYLAPNFRLILMPEHPYSIFTLAGV